MTRQSLMHRFNYLRLASFLFTLMFFCVGMYIGYTAMTKPAAAVQKPVKYIPADYCPNRPFGQPQMFYPCMYSSKERSA